MIFFDKDPELKTLFDSYLSGLKTIKNFYSHDRDLKTYEGVTNLNINQMIGKKVLDIGLSTNFTREAVDRGIDMTVLEPATGRYIPKEYKERVVHKLAQEMPFEDQSFDITIANNSVPLHLDTGDDFSALLCLYHMLRVTKSDGLIVITPFDSCAYDGVNMIDLGCSDFPRDKKWNIDMIGLLENGQFDYTMYHCGGDTVGDKVIHIYKNHHSMLAPFEDELKRKLLSRNDLK